MKIEIIHLVLLGLSSTCLAGPPLGPGSSIKDAIINGLKDWGPAGSLKPPAGQNPPIKNLPGSVPAHHKPHDPNQKTGVTRVPGKPLGPAKKCRPCLRKRQLCCDGGRKPAKLSKPTPKRPSRVTKGTRPAYKPGRFKVAKSAGKAAAFMLLAPYAHDALNAIKDMDNFIGEAVTWFDNSMADLQEAIGGPQRNDIYGNELKYKIIKGMGSALQMGFETTYEKNQRLVKEAIASQEARRAEEAKEKERIKRLEQLAVICSDPKYIFPKATPIGKVMHEKCDKVATLLRKIQARDVARSRAKKTAEPDYWFEKCKVSPKPDPIMTPRTWNFQKAKHDMQCNRAQLPELGTVCGDKCRAIISLASDDGE
ncbi:hypothetical protein NHJ13734_009260 [Beauveria thailandica]